MPIVCEQPAAGRHCPWHDNGHCHFDDELEQKKRQALQQANGRILLLGPCRQTRVLEPVITARRLQYKYARVLRGPRDIVGLLGWVNGHGLAGQPPKPVVSLYFKKLDRYYALPITDIAEVDEDQVLQSERM